MWLEESVWLWLPIASGLGLWLGWSLVALRTQVRVLRDRVAQLETTIETTKTGTRNAA